MTNVGRMNQLNKATNLLYSPLSIYLKFYENLMTVRKAVVFVMDHLKSLKFPPS